MSYLSASSQSSCSTGPSCSRRRADLAARSPSRSRLPLLRLRSSPHTSSAAHRPISARPRRVRRSTKSRCGSTRVRLTRRLAGPSLRTSAPCRTLRSFLYSPPLHVVRRPPPAFALLRDLQSASGSSLRVCNASLECSGRRVKCVASSRSRDLRSAASVAPYLGLRRRRGWRHDDFRILRAAPRVDAICAPRTIAMDGEKPLVDVVAVFTVR